MDNFVATVHHHGFIRVVDVLGNDQRVVDAARVSYTGARKRRSNEGLINTLIRDGHWSPFEHVAVTLHIKLPIVAARQWQRHRHSFNEISGRYVELPEEDYAPEEWFGKSTTNLQGSSDAPIGAQDEANRLLRNLQINSNVTYKALLGLGVSNEDARLAVTVAKYTEMWDTASLRSWMHFLQVRMDAHAQPMIREYANVIFGILQGYFPLCMVAWEREYLDAVRLTVAEQGMLQCIVRGEEPQGSEVAVTRFRTKMGWTD